MGDNAGDAAHSSELLSLAKRFLGLYLRSDVALNFEDDGSFAIEYFASGDDQLAAVPGAHAQIAFP